MKTIGLLHNRSHYDNETLIMMMIIIIILVIIIYIIIITAIIIITNVSQQSRETVFYSMVYLLSNMHIESSFKADVSRCVPLPNGNHCLFLSRGRTTSVPVHCCTKEEAVSGSWYVSRNTNEAHTRLQNPRT